MDIPEEIIENTKKGIEKRNSDFVAERKRMEETTVTENTQAWIKDKQSGGLGGKDLGIKNN